MNVVWIAWKHSTAILIVLEVIYLFIVTLAAPNVNVNEIFSPAAIILKVLKGADFVLATSTKTIFIFYTDSVALKMRP